MGTSHSEPTAASVHHWLGPALPHPNQYRNPDPSSAPRPQWSVPSATPTTGYTRELLDIVAAIASTRGYTPEMSVTPDEVGAGRPAPFMCYRNAIALGVYPLSAMVKIGDTPSDIAEGRNAGMWTVAITRTGNEIGLPKRDWDALPPAEQKTLELAAAARLTAAGAQYVAASLSECTPFLEDIEHRLATGEHP